MELFNWLFTCQCIASCVDADRLHTKLGYDLLVVEFGVLLFVFIVAETILITKISVVIHGL